MWPLPFLQKRNHPEGGEEKPANKKTLIHTGSNDTEQIREVTISDAPGTYWPSALRIKNPIHFGSSNTERVREVTI